MKRHNRLLVVLTFIFTMLCASTAMAKYNETVNLNYPLTVDLDGDKVNETVSKEERTGTYDYDLYINGSKTALSGDSIFVIDLYANDSYKEIMIGTCRTMSIYRYVKGALQQIVTMPVSDYKDVNFSSGKYLSVGWSNCPVSYGNGTISLLTYLISKGTNRNDDKSYIRRYLKYTVSGKKLVLASKQTTASSFVGSHETNTVKKNLYVYKKAGLTNNKLLYTLKKGDTFTAYKIKIDGKYVYMQVKSGKKAKGWVVAKKNAFIMW